MQTIIKRHQTTPRCVLARGWSVLAGRCCCWLLAVGRRRRMPAHAAVRGVPVRPDEALTAVVGLRRPGRGLLAGAGRAARAALAACPGRSVGALDRVGRRRHAAAGPPRWPGRCWASGRGRARAGRLGGRARARAATVVRVRLRSRPSTTRSRRLGDRVRRARPCRPAARPVPDARAASSRPCPTRASPRCPTPDRTPARPRRPPPDRGPGWVPGPPDRAARSPTCGS